ncbi:MAG: recombinase [Marinomonas sp.]|nr:MAG: recombinase [Marinomonas sp.]
MKNVKPINCTPNSEHLQKSRREAVDRELSYLPEEKRLYALNLLKDWRAQMRHLIGNDKKTVKTHDDNLERLMRHAKVAPWELRPTHVVNFFESKVDPKTGETIGPQTHAGYCSSWRSFQAYMLELERVNEIQRTFGIRPSQFVNDENNIAVKRAKSNHKPKGWALTPKQIDQIDQEFQRLILEAHNKGSKALLPLQRDRVMFHIAIHYALRVSELVTLQIDQFHAHHDPRMSHFGKYALLTVTGKNSVTGTIPLREPGIHALLEWYVQNVRQRILLRRKSKKDGMCQFQDENYLLSNLMFPSEQGGVINPNTFRKRLEMIIPNISSITKKVTPHNLRHTGCTLMVPVYSPEIAQKYMRHKNLYTTLGYYHPVPLDAASEPNVPIDLFDDKED